ncbi:MAG: Fe-S cluster assembly protein SufD [Streptosporangiaceae bacterium]
MEREERELSPGQEAAAEQAAVAAEVLRPEPEGGTARAPAGRSGDGQRQPRDARPERASSYDVDDFPVPNGSEEEWRFTPLRRLRGLHDGRAVADSKIAIEVDGPSEVRVETVGRDDERVGRTHVPTDRVSAQAYCSFPQATILTVPKETVVSRPVTVSLQGHGGTAYGHLVIDVEAFAQAVVILDHGGSVTYADNVEFVVGDSASLTVVSLQDWAEDAVHVSHHHARLGRDARFKGFVVTLGGDLVRLCPSLRYDGPGGQAEMYGLYFADAPQHQEHHLFVDHAVPSCQSRVDYKGALQGAEAHTVWISDVLIRPEAQKTDTYENNRNLVLTDGARADSVPNLEILTGEVTRAGHASATGRFDEEQLFYLMARGIPENEARKLVIRGFFTDLIQRMNIPELQRRVTDAIEIELKRAL